MLHDLLFYQQSNCVVRFTSDT